MAILFSQRPADRGMMMTTAAGQGWEAPLQRTAGTIAREVPPLTCPAGPAFILNCSFRRPAVGMPAAANLLLHFMWCASFAASCSGHWFFRLELQCVALGCNFLDCPAWAANGAVIINALLHTMLGFACLALQFSCADRSLLHAGWSHHFLAPAVGGSRRDDDEDGGPHDDGPSRADQADNWGKDRKFVAGQGGDRDRGFGGGNFR